MSNVKYVKCQKLAAKPPGECENAAYHDKMYFYCNNMPFYFFSSSCMNPILRLGLVQHSGFHTVYGG